MCNRFYNNSWRLLLLLLFHIKDKIPTAEREGKELGESHSIRGRIKNRESAPKAYPTEIGAQYAEF